MPTPPSRPRVRLQPLGPGLMGSTIVHLLAAVGIFLWLENAAASRRGTSALRPPPSQVQPRVPSAAVAWFSPADFEATFHPDPSPLPSDLPTPPQSNLRASSPAPMPPQPIVTPAPRPGSTAKAEAKYIMVSRRDDLRPPTPSISQTPATSLAATAPAPSSVAPPNHGDADQKKSLDAVDEALYEAFMTAWIPPAAEALPPGCRSARLDLSVSPGMRMVNFLLVAPSGSQDFDRSILNAATAVRDALAALRSDGTTPLGKFPTSLPSSFSKPRYDCRITFNVE